MDFKKALKSYINNNNNNTQERFNPIKITAKNPFFGRILPVANGQWPFATYNEAWISYSNRNNQISSLAVKIDPRDPNDKLGKLIAGVIAFNRQYNKEHPDFRNEKGQPEEAIKIAAGRFGLRIAKRATFLGVAVQQAQNGQYAQALNPNGQIDIKAYDISNGALNEIAKLLQPKIPYTKADGTPMFNSDSLFITANETYPINLSFEQPRTGGVGTWAGEVVSQLVLPAINFNYLEKDQLGNYKYIPDIFTLQQPLYKREPEFANTVYDQVAQSVKVQKEQLAQSSTNPYTTGFNDTGISQQQMPFQNNNNGQVDVVQGMTGQPAGNFTKPAPQAPMNNQPNPTPQSQQPVQQPVQPNNQKVQQAPVAPQTPVNNIKVQSQAPVTPQAPTSSQAPVNPNLAPQQPKNNQSAPSQAPQAQSNADDDLSVDDILNGDKNLDDFLGNN